MEDKPNYRFKLLASTIGACFFVSGCSFDKEDEVIEEVNAAPSVQLSGQNEIQEKTAFILSADAADPDGEIVSFSWQHDSHLNFSAQNSNSSEITYLSPDITEDVTVNFTVTVEDDDGLTSSATQQVIVKRNTTAVTLNGLVTDNIISYASIEITIGATTYEATADENGQYTIVLDVDESLEQALVKVKAKGRDDLNPGVEFISQLSSVKKLASQAGEDGILDSDENFGVNTTNVTTAEYALMIRDGVEPASEDELDSALLNVDAEEKIQLASLIKIIVDNPDYELPEGVDNTLELARDKDKTKQFEEEVIEKDPEIIEKTKKEIKEDTDLVTGSKEALIGDFIINSPRYYNNQALHLSLAANGTGRIHANTSVDVTLAEEDGIYTLKLSDKVVLSEGHQEQNSQAPIDTIFLKAIHFQVLAENDVFKTVEVTQTTELRSVASDSGEVIIHPEEQYSYTTNLINKSKTTSLTTAELTDNIWVLAVQDNSFDSTTGRDDPQYLRFYPDGTGDVDNNNSESFSWTLAGTKLSVNYDENGEVGVIDFWFTKKLSAGYQLVALDTSFDEPSNVSTGLMVKHKNVLTTNDDLVGRWRGFVGTPQDYDLNLHSDGTVLIGLNYTSYQGYLDKGQFTRKRFTYNEQVVTSCEGFDDSCYLAGDMTHEFVNIAGSHFYVIRTHTNYNQSGEQTEQVRSLFIYEHSKDLSYSNFTEAMLSNYTALYKASGGTDYLYPTYTDTGIKYTFETGGEQFTGLTLKDGVLSYEIDGMTWYVELVSADADAVIICQYQEGGECSTATQVSYLPKRPKVTLTANSNGNGTLSPMTQESFIYQNVGFEILPAEGYEVDSITGCEGYIEGNHYIAFANNRDCEITANFIPEQAAAGTFIISDQSHYYASAYVAELNEDNTGYLTYNGKVDVTWSKNAEGVIEITPQQEFILSEYQNTEYLEGFPVEVTVKDIATSLRLSPSSEKGSNWYELDRSIEQYRNDVLFEEYTSSYEVSKTTLDQRLAITADDIVGEWSVDLVGENTVYKVSFNQDGTGISHNIIDSDEEDFNWQVTDNLLKLTFPEDEGTESFYLTKNLAVGYQVVTQGEYEGEHYADAGIMIRRNKQAITADNFAGRHQFRDGHGIDTHWSEIQVYDDGEVFFTFGTSSYQRGFEEGHLKRDKYIDTTGNHWQEVDWCDTSLDTCELGGEFVYTLVAVDGERYYVERVTHINNNQSLDSSAHLYVHDYSPSTKVDKFNEYGLVFTLYQNDNNGIARWSVDYGDYDEEQDKQHYTFQLDDAEPVNVELVDGKLALILEGQDTVIELVDNDRRNVTFCKYLKGNSCQEESKVYLSFDAPQHTISVNLGSNGQLGITDGYQVTHGTNKYIDIIPDNGYQLDTISGCGGAVNEHGTYVTSEIFASCQIDVTFKEFIPLSTQANITDPALAMCVDSSEQENLESVTELNCQYDGYGEITSLTGLEAFTNLESIGLSNVNVGENLNLTNLPLLRQLSINDSQVSTIEVADPALIEVLKLNAIGLTTFDLSSYINLLELDFSNNNLTQLNVSANPLITHLWVYNNELIELDLSNQFLLVHLGAWANNISRLSIASTDNLIHLDVERNALATLDVSDKANLEILWINDNPLSSLDLTQNTKLQRLYANSLELNELNLSNNLELEFLDISYSYGLAGLNLSHLENLYTLRIDGLDSSLISNEQFPHIRRLEFNNADLTSFDTSGLINLRELFLQGNQFTLSEQINIASPSQLISVGLSNNQQLSSFDTSLFINLESAYLDSTNIANIDFSNNTALTEVRLSNSNLSTITGIDFIAEKSAVLEFYNNPLSNETANYLEDLRNNQGYYNIYFSTNYAVNVVVSGNGVVSDSSFTLGDNETRGISLYPDEGYEVNSISGCNGTWYSDDYYEVGPISASCEINIEFVEAIPLAEKAGITDPVLAQCANNSGYTRLEETTALYCAWSGNGEVTSLEGLGAFPNLEAFHISELNLGGGDIDVSQYPSLKVIGIHNSGVTSLLVDDPSVVTELYLTSNQLTDIDLSEYLNLQRLDLSQNALTTIDLSHNTSLNDLRLSDNQLAELDVSVNHDLMFLSVEFNLLTFINVAHLNQLESLQVGHNQLTSLEIPQLSELKWLSAERNMITELNVTMSPKLTQLSIWDNKLIAIDVSNNAQLTSFNVGSNQLTSLDLNANNLIEHLGIEHNQLASVDLTGLANLYYLDAFHNLFNEIDLSNNSLLQHVYLSDNQLTTLDLTQNSMIEYLGVGGNFLESLNLTGHENLLSLQANHNNLSDIDVSANTELEYLEVNNNQLNSIDLSENIKLAQLNLSNNQLANVNIGNNPALTFFSAEYNELTDIDTSNNSLLENLWLNDNEITAVSGLESIVNKAADINLWENNLSVDALSYLELLRDSQGYTNLRF